MPSHSRRSILRTAAVGLCATGAGCSGSTDTDTPTNDTESSSTDDESPLAADVDERVDDPPPGEPALDPDGEWPAFRFDSGNTGSNPDGNGLRDGTEYWRLDAGDAASVADGTLFNTRRGDDGVTSLAYRDPETAAAATETRVADHRVNSPPVVADGRVFVTTFVELQCYDAQTGDRLWRSPAVDGIQGVPTVHDDTVLLNSGGFSGVSPQLRAFDAENGDELWRYETGDQSTSTPAVVDGLAFIVSADGLHAVDIATGEEAYVRTDLAKRGGTPVAAGGRVYTTATDVDTVELVELDAVDGTERWRRSVVADDPPVVTDDAIYACTSEGITGFDLEDRFVTGSHYRDVRPMGLVGDVLYAAGDGTVLALDASRDLETLWALPTASVQIGDTDCRGVYGITPVDGAVYVSACDAFYGVGPEAERE